MLNELRKSNAIIQVNSEQKLFEKVIDVMRLKRYEEMGERAQKWLGAQRTFLEKELGNLVDLLRN